MLTRLRDRPLTETAWPDVSTPWWPWSYRVAGARSSWPAVEVYEAGSLLDVVSSTRLVADVVRGARSVRIAGRQRVFAWGRLPLTTGVPVVELSRGRLRASRQLALAVSVTSWCWLACAEGRYDAVTVSHDGMAVRRRLNVSWSCP